MASRPHLVLDGAVLAAEAVGADEIVIYIGGEHEAAVEAMRRAVDERRHEIRQPVRIVDGAHRLRRRRGDGRRPLHQQRRRPPDDHAAAHVRAWRGRSPDARPERREPRVRGAHRPLRGPVVPVGRPARGPRHRARHRLGRGPRPRRPRDRARDDRRGARRRGRGRRGCDEGRDPRRLLRHVGARRRGLGPAARSRRDARRPAWRSAAAWSGSCRRMPAASPRRPASSGSWPTRAPPSAVRACTASARSATPRRGSRTVSRTPATSIGSSSSTAQTGGRGACHHPDGAVQLMASAMDVFGDEFHYHARTGRCSVPGAGAEVA